MKLQDAVRLAKHAAKHATADNARRFTNHVVPEVVRPARVIWNQAIGFLFFVLAIIPLKALWQYRDPKADPKSAAILLVSAIFFVIMVCFGITSFIKARRIASRVKRF